MRYDLRPMTRVLSALLLIYVLVEVAFAGHSLALLGFISDVAAGTLDQATLAQRAEAIDAIGLPVSVGLIVALVVYYIAAGIWTYRAVANANDVQPEDSRIKPGWAVGFYFVPIANLWLPFRGVKQTWNTAHGIGDMNAAAPGWMLVWWLTWLTGNILSTAAARIDMVEEASLDDLRLVSLIDIASSGFAIVAAVLFRRLIVQITAAFGDRVVTP